LFNLIQAGYGSLPERGVQAGVTINLVEIVNRNIVTGVFVLKQVPFPKNSGDVSFDNNVFSFPIVCKGCAVP
jgi:hypothetical protein